MEPKATLVNWTPKPIETMCWCRRVMHSPVPDSLDEFIKDSKKWLGMDIDEYVKSVLLHDNMPTFLEFVHMTFLFENVSRALTHQLVRTRLASYSQQSLRCVRLPEFADNNMYHMPASVRNKKRFKDAMLKIQELYNGLLETESTEDARGILPLNVHTSIVVGCTFRALIGMVSNEMFESKFIIWIWDPNPTTFSLISCLKPVSIDTASIITARPIAMPIMAMTFMGREKDVSSRLPLMSLCAMKYGKFMRFLSFQN